MQEPQFVPALRQCSSIVPGRFWRIASMIAFLPTLKQAQTMIEYAPVLCVAPQIITNSETNRQDNGDTRDAFTGSRNYCLFRGWFCLDPQCKRNGGARHDNDHHFFSL